jgi:putative hydrolase of the HAD superfamily
MIAAVLFDLDETLLDRTGSLLEFLADQHARFADKLGRVDLGTYRERFLTLDARGSVHKSVVYPALLKEFGGAPDAARPLLEDYMENSCRYARPFQGMDDILADLHRRGLKLGIISNGETAFQWRNIDALGLRDRMDMVLISQAEGVRKPDKAIFHLAAERLGVTPAQCLFIGDNPAADVLGARNAGMQAVWFDNGMAWLDGEAEGPAIRSLTELLVLV